MKGQQLTVSLWTYVTFIPSYISLTRASHAVRPVLPSWCLFLESTDLTVSIVSSECLANGKHSINDFNLIFNYFID